MVAAAGCTGGGNEPDSDPVEVELITFPQTENTLKYEAAQRITENWAELGISTEVEPFEFDLVLEYVYEQHDFDARIGAWGGTAERIDPDFYLRQVYHSDAFTPDGSNISLFENDQVDQLADDQVNILEYEERKELTDEILQIVSEEAASVPLFSRDMVDPYNSERLAFDDDYHMRNESIPSFWNFLTVEVLEGENEMIEGDVRDVTSLNPLVTREQKNRMLFEQVYDRLLRISPNLEPEEWAAESFEIIDNETVDVVLRDDLVFHDGEDVTAEDVAFSFELQQEHSDDSGLFDVIDDIEIENDYELTFHLEEAFAPFIMNGLAFVFILPKHIWEDVVDQHDDPQDFNNDEMIGSGPWQLVSYEIDEEVVIESFGDHFHPPNLDRIVSIFAPDSQTLNNRLEAQEIDAITTGTRFERDAVESLLEEDHTDVYTSEVAASAEMQLNNQRPPFDDPDFRRAISHTVPREGIINDILGDWGTPVHSLIPEANEEWHNPDIVRYEYDMDRAREILEDAGYIYEDGQLYYPEE